MHVSHTNTHCCRLLVPCHSARQIHMRARTDSGPGSSASLECFNTSAQCNRARTPHRSLLQGRLCSTPDPQSETNQFLGNARIQPVTAQPHMPALTANPYRDDGGYGALPEPAAVLPWPLLWRSAVCPSARVCLQHGSSNRTGQALLHVRRAAHTAYHGRVLGLAWGALQHAGGGAHRTHSTTQHITYSSPAQSNAASFSSFLLHALRSPQTLPGPSAPPRLQQTCPACTCLST
jgi:hypothetical protein